ncbi:MAG TPA: shikimate kinase [Candidatus Egerieousia sp.]|nr:shikimate kinase [Candidatus Egerieousia sp.]HPT05888.1 shikimate kinase [Candidatus Egerieousia sp.]
MILSLCGFMSCGKSGMGRYLAEELKTQVIDLDSYIEAQEECTVSEYFAKNGEKKFRQTELSALKKILKDFYNKNLVLSLGGGTPMNPECNKLIKEKTFCVYLTCTIKELAFRLKDTASQRPVFAVKGETDTETWIKTMLTIREPAYLQCSRIQVDTTIWDKPAIAKKILNRLPKE